MANAVPDSRPVIVAGDHSPSFLMMTTRGAEAPAGEEEGAVARRSRRPLLVGACDHIVNPRP
jgi:hypothetical protein